jgi:hypothetical protein
MRNFIVNRNILTFFAIAVTALCLSIGFALADSPTLTIETVQSVTKDDSFAAEVNIENITRLAGLQMEIAFDPAILAAVKVEKGSFVLSKDMVSATEPEINNNTGLITKIVYVKPGQDGVSGSGVLVTITFNAIGVGESPIRLQNVKLLDPSLPEPQEIPVTIVDGSVDVVLPDPVVSDIPDQTIEEGGTFASISLDEYVSDPDNEDSEIAWTYAGNVDLSVSISDTRVATIAVPDPEWSGSETITFTATDPDGLSDSDTATFTVTAVNDPPVVSDIPDQTIAEGDTFASISLDEYVSDPDNEDSEIAWTYAGNVDLSVSISDDRVATIAVPDPEWSGSETITFTATDPDGLSDSDTATFTVTSVGDPPVVSDIPDQTIEEGVTFASVSLDEYVADADNEDSEIAWTYAGNVDLSVSISDDRVATITVPDPEWSGSETITFTATDPDGLSDSDTATFTVTPVGDPPVVSDIPDQSIVQGDAFAGISLDDYVADPDNEAAEIVWTYTGNVDLAVSISDARVATVTVPTPGWSGSETITFTATDPGELSDSDTATFTVTAVNDPPVVSDIPDRSIVQGDAFASISLDDYVTDPDNEAAEIAWTYAGNVDLSVSISDVRVATIAIPDPEWFGSETITFTATDPGGLSDSKDVGFTVFLLGDVNNDGAVRSNDAIMALRFAAGLLEPTEDQKLAADMNKDGNIASNDAIRILRKAAGLGAPGADYVTSPAGTVTITLAEAHGVAGESVTVPLKVDNFAGLAGGDIRIAYDPAVLRAVDVLPGSAKGSEKLLVANLAEPGMVHISFASSDSLSSKMLASIKFEVLADDVSPLMFKSVGIYGFNALPLVSKGIDEVFRSWAIPAEYNALLQNFPNPFNPETWVPFQLKEGSKVTIRIYSSAGNLVRELDLGYRSAGLYVSQDRAAYWDGMTDAGERVSSGVYFYNIQAGNYSATRKMIVVR